MQQPNEGLICNHVPGVEARDDAPDIVAFVCVTGGLLSRRCLARKSGAAPKKAAKARRYRIKVTDIASRKDVLMTVASWTDEEKHVAIMQIARLAGLPPEAADLFGSSTPSW
jgi:hypothetical protein